jgi:hypothetical protein
VTTEIHDVQGIVITADSRLQMSKVSGIICNRVSDPDGNDGTGTWEFIAIRERAVRKVTHHVEMLARFQLPKWPARGLPGSRG